MSDKINITPDMINNLVDILKRKNSDDINSSDNANNNMNTYNSEKSSGIFSNFSTNSSSEFDTQNLDINAIIKIKSILDTLNKKDDPKSNLLYSLKPYLRKSKQAKLDQYVNILKISQVAEIFSNNNGNSKEDSR